MNDFVSQNLGFDTKRPIAKLRRPHITEKIVIHEPITFLCRKRYEEANAILEGLIMRHVRGGQPEI